MVHRISGIYKITNLVNNKVYIEQSVNIRKRWNQHVLELNKNIHPNIYLQSAWNKYGEINFKFSILEETGNLNEAEIKWIKYYSSNNRKFGYNLDGGGNKNKTISEETRRKVSEINKGRKRSKETRDKISQSRKGKYGGKNNPRYGVKLPKEIRDKISKSLKGNIPTNKGKSMSEEFKLKDKLAHLGKNMKLNQNQISEIREKYATGEYNHKKLAEEYNIGGTTVSYIVNCKGAYKNR
ncbi:NUMOD3 domain-containing DNA-binding protein [Clostridium guangxiense]|uniref:NUMOD3 domain-containing DNA-binding protein n=1 Tax=Clostridium guangxiense TaxID=1662055 RepID=UPI001E5C1994|nr:NUMOD3 domain-containing DNA-binding protein [Clostridium guangxiense]MCD2345816.1 GIY-YIG nuclease family protein [Clostridium guangxiense]